MGFKYTNSESMYSIRKCNKCEKEKSLDDFNHNRNTCKKCMKKYRSEYGKKNKEKISEYNKKYVSENRESVKEYLREYYSKNEHNLKEYREKYRETNKEKIRKRNRDYYLNNKDEIDLYRKEYRLNNKDRLNENIKCRKSVDKLYKLINHIRSKVTDSLSRGGYSKKTKTYDILGCEFEILLEHLNNNTYGFSYGDDYIDIDHIIPLSSAQSESELLMLSHYTNLQLLPSVYNRHIKRDNKWDIEDFEGWLNETPL